MSDNYSLRESAGTLVGAVVLPVWSAGRYLQTTVAAILAFVLAAGDSFAGATSFSSLSMTKQILIASGAFVSSFCQLNHASVKIEATLAALAEGKVHVFTQIDAGTAAHTVTLSIGTFDGTNNTATFNAAGESLLVMGMDGTDGVIIENIGGVAMSSA